MTNLNVIIMFFGRTKCISHSIFGVHIYVKYLFVGMFLIRLLLRLLTLAVFITEKREINKHNLFIDL